MIQLYKSPQVLKKAYPNLIWDKQSKDEIYLTFDDGPHPEITPWVLNELSKHDAIATFFCIGNNLKDHRKISEDVIAEGNLIANHSFNHENGWQVSNEEYFKSIRACNELVEDIQGSRNRLFRPPYGKIKNEQIRKLNKDYDIVMWSHLAWDFKKNLDISKSMKELKKAGPGSVVVFHDNEKSLINLKLLLPEVLSYWSSLDFKFSTL